MKEIPFKQGNRIYHELDSILQDLEGVLQDLEKSKARILELMDIVTLFIHVPKSIKKICSYLPEEEEGEE